MEDWKYFYIFWTIHALKIAETLDQLFVEIVAFFFSPSKFLVKIRFPWPSLSFSKVSICYLSTKGSLLRKIVLKEKETGFPIRETKYGE